MSIAGLDHVQMAMPPGGEGEARAFYSGLLGLTEVQKPASLVSRGGCWFEGAGAHVHLGVQDEFVPALKAHPAFLVHDLAALRQDLEQAGVLLVPDQVLPGVRRFYASDPFGNRIEFLQDGDGFSQGKDWI